MTSADYLSTGQVAGMFRVTGRTVLRWAREGLVDAKIGKGGRREYNMRQIQRLLADQFEPADTPLGHTR